MAEYLTLTAFGGVGTGYEIEIADPRDLPGERHSTGITVYSECCADDMSIETARKVHAALGEYLAVHDARS